MILQFLQIKKKMHVLFEGYTKCYNSLIPFGLFPNQILLYLAHDIHTVFIDYMCFKNVKFLCKDNQLAYYDYFHEIQRNG